MDGEVNVTWASVEKDVPYSKVVWHFQKNGIPTYTFLDENGKSIEINV